MENELRKNAIFILGLNGAGKSTIRDDIASAQDILIIDPDKIAKEHNCNSVRAGKIALKMFDDAIKNNQSFLLESTLSGYSIIKQIKIAKENSYSVRAYFVGLKSLNNHIDRVNNRVKNGGHNIAEDIIRHRFDKTYNNIKKLFPIVNYLRVIDNSVEFTTEAKIINGKLKQKKQVCDWVTKHVITPFVEYKLDHAINSTAHKNFKQNQKQNSNEIE
ncbi:zeta toxin family protein [Gilliamella sp. Bif1-4]|uniref:zeta toxin family protein n=1 Tax=Gilliamella sp. Bif1-4 TaxID=3120233 RepID=UPI00080E8D11|nr:zeta toxin family protein [Gilliamella apicola]OCG40841.1 hypothetical protein A9G25_06785 [Gilliamella apicola]